MSEEIKPTYEQLANELHRTRVGLNKAIQQRDASANEVIDITVQLDEARRIAQAQTVEIGNLRLELEKAKAVPANRAERRKK